MNRPQARGVRGAAALWLVSFGDLLTLLLAFFVSALATTPQANHEREPEAKAGHQDHSISLLDDENPGDTTDAGISLADPSVRSGERVFTLYLDDLDLQGLESSKAHGLKSLAAKELSALEVEACSPYTVQAREAANRRIVQTVELIRREVPQLLEGVRVQPLKDLGCEQLRKDGASLAVIRIVGLRDGRRRRGQEEGRE